MMPNRVSEPSKEVLKVGDLYVGQYQEPFLIADILDDRFVCIPFGGGGYRKHIRYNDSLLDAGVFLRDNKGKLEVIAVSDNFFNYLELASEHLIKKRE